MKAVLYCRVSSKEQEQEGFSLDAQEKTGRDYARTQHLDVVRSWKVAESAWSKGRDDFNRMVDYVKNHPEVAHIIFDCPDRMTRNDFDKLKISELVKEHGKTIHFSRTRKIISSASGSDDEFLFDIEVAVAKKWSNDISRKASMGMQEKANQGLYPGLVPLGYLNDPITRTVRVDPDKSPLVVRAFELMASGQCSLSMLVGRLRDLGLRTRQERPVQKSSLEQMLKNSFYYGSFVWKNKTYQGKHQPLISKQLFDAANDAMAGRGFPSKPRAIGYAFNNIATCGICGCRIVGETKKQHYLYYHCTFSKGRHADVPYIPESSFIAMFDESVQRVTISDECLGWLKDVLEDAQAGQSEATERRSTDLFKQKATVENRLSRLYDSLCDGVLTAEAFSRKEAEYRAELIGVERALKECEVDRNAGLEEGLEIFELANRLYPTYLDFDTQEKAQLLRLIASNYTLNGRTISATYKKPFSLLMELPPRPIKLP